MLPLSWHCSQELSTQSEKELKLIKPRALEISQCARDNISVCHGGMREEEEKREEGGKKKSE